MTDSSLSAVREVLRYQAARAGLGTLDADAIKRTILELMDGGFYVDECLSVLDAFPHPRMEEVFPAFKAALDHHGLTLPSREEAIWQLIRHWALRMASEDMDAAEELDRLMADIYFEYDFHTPTRGFLGDSHGIERLIGLHWRYEGQKDGSNESPPDVESLHALTLGIRSEARRWLAQYP